MQVLLSVLLAGVLSPGILFKVAQASELAWVIAKASDSLTQDVASLTHEDWVVVLPPKNGKSRVLKDNPDFISHCPKDDPCRDGEFESKVHVKAADESVFIVRGIEHLKPLATAAIKGEKNLFPRSQVTEIQFGKKTYKLKSKYVEKEDEPIEFEVKLERGSKSQSIFYLSIPKELEGRKAFMRFDLIWAGDLDRDKKLDLVVEQNSGTKDVLILMLSSSAVKASTFVGETSQFQL